MILVRLAKEEEGVGISTGAHLAGARSAMLMQNHGFLQSINGVVSLALLYKIPLLMLITDRGYLGEGDPWQTEGGKVTRRLLDSLGIVRDELVERDAVAAQVDRAMTLAQSSLSPVALLLTRPLMWEERPLRAPQPHPPGVRQREPAIGGWISDGHRHGLRPGGHRPGGRD